MTRKILSSLPVGLLLLSACSDKVEVFEATNAELAARVGEPCVLADEALPQYGGLSSAETVVERQPDECGAGVCLSYGFQGRVSCPEGNDDADDPECLTTGGEPVTVPVLPQLPDRPAEDAVICTCRCDGPAGEGPFCACPAGFECQLDVIADLSVASRAEAGGYCVKSPD
jgi:hypothetical protein